MKLTAFPQTIFCLVLLLCRGSFAPSVAAQGEPWSHITISAPPQTVEVRTPRGGYLAVFQEEVQVYPNGAASGFLDLSEPDGRPRRFQVIAGHAQVHGDVTGRITGLAVDPADPTGHAFVVHIRPVPSEPCRIYDIAGTQVNAHFEAETLIEVIRN